jgi:hypothetical protein
MRGSHDLRVLIAVRPSIACTASAHDACDARADEMSLALDFETNGEPAEGKLLLKQRPCPTPSVAGFSAS